MLITSDISLYFMIRSADVVEVSDGDAFTYKSYCVCRYRYLFIYFPFSFTTYKSYCVCRYRYLFLLLIYHQMLKTVQNQHSCKNC